jgi:hypothetical protein
MVEYFFDMANKDARAQEQVKDNLSCNGKEDRYSLAREDKRRDIRG